MALNPIVFTEKVVRSFLRYQLTANPFADVRLNAQMRRLLSLEETRQSPLLKGPYISQTDGERLGLARVLLRHDGLLAGLVAGKCYEGKGEAAYNSAPRRFRA